MGLIFNDTPDDFINIANRIDSSKVDMNALPAQLKELETKFIVPNVPLRKRIGTMVKNEKIPQIVADVLNRYDWKEVGIIKRKLAKVAVEQKLTELGLL